VTTALPGSTRPGPLQRAGLPGGALLARPPLPVLPAEASCYRADDRDRTGVADLEGQGTAIVLHPHSLLARPRVSMPAFPSRGGNQVTRPPLTPRCACRGVQMTSYDVIVVTEVIEPSACSFSGSRSTN
jgi:hypothetical protein